MSQCTVYVYFLFLMFRSIGVSEKGSATVKLTVSTVPGHSSMPPKESTIGILAAAVKRWEEAFCRNVSFFYVFCLRLPELRNAISQTRGKSNAKILWLWTWTQYIWAFGPQGKDSSFSLFHFTKSDNISLSIQLFPTSFSSAYRWSL